jgi:hypothetical protein
LKPGIIYRGYFKNQQATAMPANTPDEQEVIISIYDTETLIDNAASETIIDLELSDNPVVISVVDNDEDKFTPIKSKQAEIRIHSSNSVDISTFASGGDNRWKVEVAINDTNFKWFVGFLAISDLQMEFAPDPNEILLTATDNLHALKDIPLTDFDGITPRGYQRIAQFISWALWKTGVFLDIHVINNIREEDYPDLHFYDAIYLHSKTFEDEIGTCEDCFTVLEKILGESCFLTQWKGKWFIQNIDELDSHSIVQARFAAGGAFMEFHDPVNWIKSVGENLPLSWVGLPDSPPLVTIERPNKEIKETFNLDLPKEIPDNINFEHGAWISPLVLGPLAAAYVIDDWTLERVSGSPEISAYIKRVYLDTNWTYENERYVVLTAGATGQHWIKSNPIYLDALDKLSFSIDRRLSANQSGSGTVTEAFAWIRLYADDGTFYNLNNDAGTGNAAGEWVQSNSTFSTNQRFIQLQYKNEDVKEAEEWLTASVDSKPLPKSGSVRILLMISSAYGGTAQTHFANLSFTYTPHINGSYSKYSAIYHKVSQALNTTEVRAKQVFISDGIKRLFKGALHKIDSGTGAFVLTTGFFNAVQTPTPVSTDIKPYGELQAFGVWNQFNRHFMKFDGTVDGLDTGLLDGIDGQPDSPDLLQKFQLSDTDPTTSNKYFMLLHCEQDLNQCQLTAFLYEVFDLNQPKVYTGHEFKYVSGQ